MKYILLAIFLFSVSANAQVQEKTDNKVQDTLVVDSGGKDSLEIYKPTIEDYKFKTQFSDKKKL